jgi:hypothetical protein
MPIISRQEPYLRTYETHTLKEAGAIFKDIVMEIQEEDAFLRMLNAVC